MGDAGSKEPRSAPRPLATRLFEVADGLTGEVSSLIQRVAIEAAGASIDLGRAVLGVPDNPGLAKEAGAYLRELREVAGLTRDELSAAISLEDRALLEAVEEGTATLSFELVLRLAAIVARHDPVPFVMRFARTYSPEVWTRLEGLGPGRWPLQVERERPPRRASSGCSPSRARPSSWGCSTPKSRRPATTTRRPTQDGSAIRRKRSPKGSVS
jgi:transcriptional regulator with XRE-family HTH domain